MELNGILLSNYLDNDEILVTVTEISETFEIMGGEMQIK